MAISINPVLPVLAAQEAGSVAPDLVLQAGSVVDAQVLKVLSADLVRIAIASLSIDVASEVPLSEGQTLRLAVSQTQDGTIRLAVVGQDSDAPRLSGDAVTLSPDVQVDAPANPAQPGAVAKNLLTPLERTVVLTAAQAAATEQQSLAPLFANLGAVTSAATLPPKLQHAIAEVLAQQTRLDPKLDGADIKQAFEKSGLFLEASLAAGTVAPGAGAPDLKAALIVLRQALQSSLGTQSSTATPPAGAPAPPPDTVLPAALAPGVVPPIADLEVQEILLPQARVPVADHLMPDAASRSAAAMTPGPGTSAAAALSLLQEALQELGSPVQQAAAREPRNGDGMVRPNAPPPFRGALPAAQPVALPSIAPGTPLPSAAHHLLENTEGALARQTLLQVASLPDRVDIAQPQADPGAPSWHFEIPFATPQGTAMAQFEISRDGGGTEVEAAQRVWRARFSLDVEPAGPVHALVSLTGGKTSVRMWAERPATAAQLRAGAAQLSRALSQAELLPGDIVVRDGAPPQAAPARAGHFLDRAL